MKSFIRIRGSSSRGHWQDDKSIRTWIPHKEALLTHGVLPREEVSVRERIAKELRLLCRNRKETEEHTQRRWRPWTLLLLRLPFLVLCPRACLPWNLSGADPFRSKWSPARKLMSRNLSVSNQGFDLRILSRLLSSVRSCFDLHTNGPLLGRSCMIFRMHLRTGSRKNVGQDHRVRTPVSSDLSIVFSLVFVQIG